ncbi:MAG TPA: hypothetical protein VF175_12055 [Lacipirellula sp.]
MPAPARAGAARALFAPDSAEACELLEALDDAMFTAIAGDESVVITARDLWLQAVECLPAELVEESREQYLRYAADVARRLDGEEVCDPDKVVVAVEIIELLAAG